jgi:hypothetical protein
MQCPRGWRVLFISLANEGAASAAQCLVKGGQQERKSDEFE